LQLAQLLMFQRALRQELDGSWLLRCQELLLVQRQLRQVLRLHLLQEQRQLPHRLQERHRFHQEDLP
jgi:hypothetical protein